MSVTQDYDEKSALIDFLRNHASVTAQFSASHIVGEIEALGTTGLWLVVLRLGGPVDPYSPLIQARMSLIAYHKDHRQAAVRGMRTVSRALGLDDPRSVPRITGSGVIVSDIQAEHSIQDGIDNDVPNRPVKFAMRTIRLTVHWKDVAA